MKITKRIRTEKDMQMLGAALAEHSKTGIVIFLHGELGAGKTTFVRGFLRKLGHKGIVKSPTYTLIEPYELAENLYVYHADLYRLENPNSLEDIGLSDYLNSDAICLIEWPEKGGFFLPKPSLQCFIEIISNGREVSLVAENAIGNEILKKLAV